MTLTIYDFISSFVAENTYIKLDCPDDPEFSYEGPVEEYWDWEDHIYTDTLYLDNVSVDGDTLYLVALR